MNPFVDIEEIPVVPEEATGTSQSNVGGISIGSGSTSLKADSSGLWLGANKWEDAPFRVDMKGNMFASSADLTGSGYSMSVTFAQPSIPTSVAIGDLWVDTDNNNKMYRAEMIGANEIKAGEWVEVDQDLYKLDKVGGSYTTTLLTAARVQIFPTTDIGIRAYAYDGTSVVFQVNVGGTNVGDVLIGDYNGGSGMLWDNSASTLYIKGDIVAGNIDATRITSGTLSTSRIPNLSADKITTGTLNADRIEADSIGASKLDVDTLSAITANMGTLTAGAITGGTITGVTITGGTIRTAASGSRVQMSNSDKIKFYSDYGEVGRFEISDYGFSMSSSYLITVKAPTVNITSTSGKINIDAASGEDIEMLGQTDFNSNNVSNINKLHSKSRSAVDKSGSVGDTYSLEVSNNNGNGKGLADNWDTYSEYTEIETVHPKYRIKDKDELLKKSLEQILKRAEYKVKAHYNNTSIKMDEKEFESELDRVLKKKDWGFQAEADAEADRVSTLEWGTLVAFSDKGIVPTSKKGQTNITGVVSSYPSITAHQQENGINICKSGKTYLKVYGKCEVGDLLQSSDKEGCAEKAPADVKIGSLVGRVRVKKDKDTVDLIEVDLV